MLQIISNLTIYLIMNKEISEIYAQKYPYTAIKDTLFPSINTITRGDEK